jgi:hypothetical protein
MLSLFGGEFEHDIINMKYYSTTLEFMKIINRSYFCSLYGGYNYLKNGELEDHKIHLGLGIGMPLIVGVSVGGGVLFDNKTFVPILTLSSPSFLQFVSSIK